MVLGNTSGKEDDAVTAMEEFKDSANIVTMLVERLDTELTEANNKIESLEKDLEDVQTKLEGANKRLRENDLEEIG